MFTLLRQASLLLWVATLWLVSPARCQLSQSLTLDCHSRKPTGIISSQAHCPSSAAESMGSGTVSATMSNTDWGFRSIGNHLCRIGCRIGCGACGMCSRRREHCVFTALLPQSLFHYILFPFGLSHAENTQTLKMTLKGMKNRKKKIKRESLSSRNKELSPSNWEFLNIV